MQCREFWLLGEPLLFNHAALTVLLPCIFIRADFLRAGERLAIFLMSFILPHVVLPPHRVLQEQWMLALVKTSMPTPCLKQKDDSILRILGCAKPQTPWLGEMFAPINVKCTQVRQ